MESNAIWLGILTLLLGGVGYLVLFSGDSKKKQEEAVREMAFQLDDQDWGDEGEDEGAGTPELNLTEAMKSMGAAGAPPATAAAAAQNAAGMPNMPRGKTPAQLAHDESLPYQIGDRIILQNLVGAANLNGRHGCIASAYDKKTSRYPVDLDLPNRPSPGGPSKPLAVKEANLSKEPVVKPDDLEDMPALLNGCLEPAHAKVASFIFHVLRVSCSQTLKGETNSLKLAAFGWQYWKPVPPAAADSGVYFSLKNYLCKGILAKQKLADLDKQVSPDPEKPVAGAYKLVTKAMASEQAVAAWNVRVEGEFWIVGMGPQGTMVVPCINPRQVYVVAGFQAPLMAIAGGNQTKFPRPPKFHLTLLPWFGVLIHDTFLCTTTGSNQVELASPQLAPQLIELTKRAVAEGRVITCLKQLHAVKPPNLEGVPLMLPKALVQQAQMAQQPPLTDGEKAVSAKVAKITDIIGPPNGLWNFIRPPMKDGSKPPYIILNATGEQLDTFAPPADAKPEQLPELLLQQILELVDKQQETNDGNKKQRPAAVGVDDPKLCQRLQFICQKIPNLRILMLNVKPNAATAVGEGTAKPAEETKAAE